MNKETLPVSEELTEMPMFGFDKDEKAKALPIKLLARSIRVEDTLGRTYRTRPIQAWTLLAHIVGLLKDMQIAYVPKPIMVRKDSSGVALNDVDRNDNKFDKTNCPVNRWMFNELITKIDIPHIGGDLTNGSIAVCYTKRGISTALGLNVNVCDNMSILGGQQMRTYKYDGNAGLDWETMKIHLRDWLSNLDQKLAVEVEIMERMMGREINNEIAVDQVVGKLYQNAVAWRYAKGPAAPFDISGMSSFVQNIQRSRSREELNNVWDLYNWGTNVMKPEMETLEHLTEASRLYADFLCEEFAIERDDLLTAAEIVEG